MGLDLRRPWPGQKFGRTAAIISYYATGATSFSKHSSLVLSACGLLGTLPTLCKSLSNSMKKELLPHFTGGKTEDQGD